VSSLRRAMLKCQVFHETHSETRRCVGMKHTRSRLAHHDQRLSIVKQISRIPQVTQDHLRKNFTRAELGARALNDTAPIPRERFPIDRAGGSLRIKFRPAIGA
jgi:hypothetical protein